MKYKIIVFILICIIGCNKSAIKSDIKINKIKVYYVPFLITPIGSHTASDIKMLDGFYIENKHKIKKIKKELLKITSIEVDFLETNIHLLCDFYNDKGEKEFTLFCDKFNIKINDKVYKKNDKLINLLIKN